MKKGQVYNGKVVRLDFPNKGIVDCEGKVAIVKGTLPGQEIEFVVSKKRTGKVEGRLKEVLKKSSLESEEPVCPVFDKCGGCNYQTINYENQLELKKNQVKRILDNVCDNYEFEGILQSPSQWEYRNKMEYSFGDEYKGGPLTLGLHKKGNFYDIITTNECKIVSADYNKILDCVLEYALEKGYSFYHKMSHEGILRHLLIRRGVKTGDLMVNIVTTSEGVEEKTTDFSELANKLLLLELDGTISGISHIINDSLSDTIKCDKSICLYGKDYFYEELLGLRFKVSTFSFFQTNSLGAEVLYSKVREYVGDTRDKLIYDLYSGTGTISQILAPVAKKVVGVEIIEEAVVAARENAKMNNLSNCEFIAGDVLKVLDDLSKKPDIIVLDPPRDGINPKALKKIINYGVSNLVYISCKPTSLARDLEEFIKNGYEVEKVCAVDMFPNVVHVETVVLLSKGEVDSKKVRVEFSLEDMDMSDFQDSATYAQIKDYVLEHSGLKVSNLYISQIKRKCGIEVGKNYNLPKSEDSRQPQCPKEKEKAIRDALKHFGMI